MKTLPASKKPWIDYAGNIINGGTDLVMGNLSPYPDLPPPQGKADVTIPLNVTRTGEFGWVLNGKTWTSPPDNFTPLLFQPSQFASGREHVLHIPQWFVVDLIFTVTAGNPAVHLLTDAQAWCQSLVAWFGDGPFPYASIQDAVNAGYKGINMKNPPFRDDFVTPVAVTGRPGLLFVSALLTLAQSSSTATSMLT
ncbi:multicopper oxidase family [Rhizoctonia solani]|uniref:Multicopper oxidase family n=1 Tax=Rhizoctonia solani TaxID=456999 RepID=A0A8H7M9I9_9AGAM|nr:multicopper oxidase family [Rhizoctonia solani]